MFLFLFLSFKLHVTRRLLQRSVRELKLFCKLNHVQEIHGAHARAQTDTHTHVYVTSALALPSLGTLIVQSSVCHQQTAVWPLWKLCQPLRDFFLSKVQITTKYRIACSETSYCLVCLCNWHLEDTGQCVCLGSRLEAHRVRAELTGVSYFELRYLISCYFVLRYFMFCYFVLCYCTFL
jgi:hypothetical protein